MTKYIFVLLISVFNYFLTFYIGFFVSKFLYNESLIPVRTVFVVTYSINIVLVLIEWGIFKKYIGNIKTIASNNINLLLFAGLSIIPIFYFIYRGFLGVPNIDTSDTSLVLYSFVSTVILLPIIEELIYRDILFRIFFRNTADMVPGILFISFLFTLTHIASWDIDWLYLIYIFILSIISFLLRIKYGLLYAIFTHSFVNFLSFLLKIRILDIIF